MTENNSKTTTIKDDKNINNNKHTEGSSSYFSWLPWRKSNTATATNYTDDKSNNNNNNNSNEINNNNINNKENIDTNINNDTTNIKRTKEEREKERKRAQQLQQSKEPLTQAQMKELREQQIREQKYQLTKKYKKEEIKRKLEKRKVDLVEMVLDPPINNVDLTFEQLQDLSYSRLGNPNHLTPKVILWGTGAMGGVAGGFVGNSLIKNHPIKSLKSFVLFVSIGCGAYATSKVLYDQPHFNKVFNDFQQNSYDVLVEDYFMEELPSLILARQLKKANKKLDKYGNIVQHQ